MKIQKIIVGMLETNTYIISEESTNKAFIIDPGDEEKEIMKYIQKHSLKPVGIILTHYHHDHIGAGEELRNQYKCSIYIHKKDAEGLKNPEINRSKIRCRRLISLSADTMLSEGDTIALENLELYVIHTPGHTPGSICLGVKNTNIIFTGDTIFRDGLGRTDLEGGSEKSLKKSIQNKVSKWEDEIIIYPGHGETSTIKEVRKNRFFL